MSCKFDMVTVTRRAPGGGGKRGHIGLVEKPRHVEVRLAITHIKRKSFYCTTNFTIFFAL